MHKAGAFFFVCAGLLGLALLLPRPAAAAWPSDPFVNLPLCVALDGQEAPAMVTDGAGGAIVAWHDRRGGTYYQAYALHVLASGTVDPAWPVNGRALCLHVGHQYGPQIVTDGAGGAIVVWEDNRNTWQDIFAQHVLAGGAVDPAWPAAGLAVCTAANLQQGPRLITDGAGGAIVTWYDRRSADADIYAQRLLAEGTIDPTWPANGRALCAATNDQILPTVVPDGAGGAIVAWQDARNPGTCDPYWGQCGDIYAQRVSAGGVVDPAWPANGRALSTASGEQIYPVLLGDGAGGAIAAWQDSRNGNDDLYAQRVQAGGAVDPAWPADGRALCTTANLQWSPAIASDGASGAIVCWEDHGSADDIHAQRVSVDGTVRWGANGMTVCADPGFQLRPGVISDGAGGAIVAWEDDSLGVGASDLYAGRILASGVMDPAWPVNGRAVCMAEGNQAYAAIVPGLAGGVILAWTDARNDYGDIYAQYIQANGQLGSPSVSVPGDASLALGLDPVRPNPLRGSAFTVRFTLPGGTAASLELLDVAGRRIATREVGSFGAGRHALDLGEGQHLAPGLYLVCLRQGANTRVMRAVVLR